MSPIQQARNGLEHSFVTSSSSCCGYCNADGYGHLENTAWQWLSVELQFIYMGSPDDGCSLQEECCRQIACPPWKAEGVKEFQSGTMQSASLSCPLGLHRRGARRCDLVPSVALSLSADERGMVGSNCLFVRGSSVRLACPRCCWCDWLQCSSAPGGHAGQRHMDGTYRWDMQTV